jgi:CBS domain containing-hemolysin-like protein
METATALTWLGIGLCVLQSGSFSGLNLSLFGISALQLEAQAAAGDADARRLLTLRRDTNFLLSTVLWGNVGTNVLLTLLTDSVLAGVLGFAFSTFVITFGGEIIPQAYFSRNALRMATLMRPFLRFWQLALYPIAKPTALLLDAWLGGESIDFMRETELRELIKRYVAVPATEIGRVEGIGVLNFMALDDLSVREEGAELDPKSLLELPEEGRRPVFPAFEASHADPFLRRVEASGKKWVVLTSPAGEPLLVLDADAFLRDALLGAEAVRVEHFCHRPIVVSDPATKIGDVLPRLRTDRKHAGDDVIDEDLILVWGEERRIITGADILGRLLRGIARPGP